MTIRCLAEALTTTLILTSSFQAIADAKKVIFFSVFQTSHTLTFVKVAKALEERGHEAYVAMSATVYNRTFLNEAQIHPIVYGEKYGDIIEEYQRHTQQLENFWHSGPNVFRYLYNAMKGVQFSKNLLRDIFADKTFMGKILEIQADLFVLDTLPHYRSALALPYALNTPFILMGSYYDPIISRIPFSPACTPHPMLPNSLSTESFFQRLSVAVFRILLFLYDPFWDAGVLSAISSDIPYITSWELTVKAEMFLYETDHIAGVSLPQLPNTKLIGGVSPLPAKPLQGDLQAFVNKSANGIVVVTFGTFSYNIPDEIAVKMISAFRAIPCNVVWRANVSSPDPAKIMTTNWIPQNDLLGHKHTQIFVSHCGLWGYYEALYHGVPILCLPLFSDQFHNADLVVTKGFGMKADIRTISADELARLIMEIVSTDMYRNNIRSSSELFRKLYKIPAKEAAFWIDHVMEYGGSYMRSQGQIMPLYQFLCLDLLAGCFGGLIFACSIVICICRRFRSSRKRKTE